MNEEWEIVADGEASLEDYPLLVPGPEGVDVPVREETATHNADGTQKLDEFGAPLRPVVRVRDGVKDTRRR